MKLNKIEFLLMNNPLRAFIQKNYEIKKFIEISNVIKIKNALEIGCGNGYGSYLINRHFQPNKLFAIDIDGKMIQIAKKGIEIVLLFSKK